MRSEFDKKRKLLMRNNCLKAAFLALFSILLTIGAQAASVGPTGYTNAFATLPAVTDWMPKWNR
jgi:hypothetical protein